MDQEYEVLYEAECQADGAMAEVRGEGLIRQYRYLCGEMQSLLDFDPREEPKAPVGADVLDMRVRWLKKKDPSPPTETEGLRRLTESISFLRETIAEIDRCLISSEGVSVQYVLKQCGELTAERIELFESL